MADSAVPAPTETPFDPQMINEFRHGIFTRDPELVRKALDAKVDVTTPVRGRHPLQMLIGFDYADMPEEIRRSMSERDFERRTTEIVQLLFDHGAKVAEPEKYATSLHNTLADRLVLADNLVDLSTVIVHAIDESLAEGGQVYQPDPKKVVAASLAATDGKVDVVAHVNIVLGALERLHNTVRNRLEHPTSDLEQQIVARHGTQIREFTQPYRRPPVRTIIEDLFPQGQMPPEVDDALSQMNGAFGGRGRGSPSEYVETIEKKAPKQVLQEIKDDFVGLTELKNEARSLVFRQSFDAVNKDTAAPNRVYGEVIMGNEGLGKSEFLRKKAELLVSLGLAGDKYVEFSQRNSAAASIGLPPKALAAIFAQADIVNLEIPEPINDGRPDVADFGKRLVGALLLSMEGREKPPILFLSGKPETIGEVLATNPALKPLIGGYTKLEDMDAEALSQILVRKLKKDYNLTIDDDARAEVLSVIDKTRSSIGGKGFTNAYEIANIVTRLPDAIALRVLGSAEDDAPANDTPAAEMHNVTLADVKALNLRKILTGPLLAKRPQIGF
ncbi:MAG TPA: hypothetical protein VEF76_00520 [Patescibacteria group bacterium]|nr:hypothetical protein [Patescibacteria group bacterium]